MSNQRAGTPIAAACCVAVGLLLFSDLLGPGRLVADENGWVPVRCPAIERDDRRRTRHPGEPSRPVDLVVVGQVTPGSEANQYQIKIERTLFGHCSTTEIACRSFRQLAPSQVQIIALVTGWHAGLVPFEVKYVAPLDELAAHEALARARMDWHVAASIAVFVGRDAADESGMATGEQRDSGRRFHVRRVIVGESLAGAPFKPGETVYVDLLGIPRNSHRRAAHDMAEVFFVSGKAAAEGGVPARWEVNYRLPAALRDQIAQAVPRRERHPLLTGKRNGKSVVYREVLFDGTLEEAVGLLDARDESAVELGVRRLLHERAAALPIMASRIDKRLLEQPTDATAPGFRQQARLLETLAEMENGRTDGEAGRRVRRILDAIRAGTAGPPADVSQEAPSDPYGANHSLSWLVESLDGEAVARDFGAELILLATQSDPLWQREIRELLAETRIEQYVEWNAAAQRLRGEKPVRSRPALWHDGRYLVGFSPSGRRFVTLGTGVGRVWNTSDWSLAAEWTCEGTFEAVAFTPDDRRLWIAGERDDSGVLELLEAATGKVVTDLSEDRLPLDAMALSRDGRVLVTASDEEQHLHVWDAVEGKMLRTLELADGSARFTLRPDGKLLLREIHADSWQWESLEAAPKPVAGTPLPARSRSTRLPLRMAAYAPTGDVLYGMERAMGYGQLAEVADNPAADGGVYVVSARRGGGDFGWLPQRSEPLVGSELKISAGGSRLAVLSPRETQWTFTLLELPSLRTVSRCLLPHSALAGHLESWQLSPDGKVLAVALEDEPPGLFNTETGERFVPGLGHRSGIVELTFAADGRTLVTRDEEGGECEWEASTLRIVRRLVIPDENRQPAPRPALDGPYSEDGRTVYRIQVDSRGRQVVVHATDLATGMQRKVGEAALPWVPDGPRGLVPGGRYLHCGTVVLDRESLRLVSSKPLRGWNVQRMVWSHDGARYAVAAERYVNAEGGDRDERVVTIHETLTGRIVAVLPTLSRQVMLMAFSPNGQRLVLALENNEVQGWSLPGP